MDDRTSPEDAAERIAWELNFHRGEEISLNELADLTDLSWATVRKYTQLIETLQKITPAIQISSDGIRSGERTEIVDENLSEPERALAVYTLHHAELNGGATAEVDEEVLTAVVENSNILTEMVQLGWVERSDNNVRLTPLGVKIAGKARSEVLTSASEITQQSKSGWQTEYTNSETSIGNEQGYELNDVEGQINSHQDSSDESAKMFKSAPAT